MFLTCLIQTRGSITVYISFWIVSSFIALIFLNFYSSVIYRVILNDCQDFNNLPPRSSDATPCDLFLWGYVKDQVYVPSLPGSIPELKVRIRTAIETITADMLQTVWNELDIVLMFVESQRVHI